MGNFNTFTQATEVGGVLANDIAAANHGKANATGFSCTRFAMSGPVSDIIELFAPGFGDGFAHGQCCARGGVDFVAVVSLEDFGIKALLHQACRYLEQFEADIYPNTHIGRKNNGDIPCGLGNGGPLLVIESCGTDNTTGTEFLACGQISKAALGKGEVNQTVSLL